MLPCPLARCWSSMPTWSASRRRISSGVTERYRFIPIARCRSTTPITIPSSAYVRCRETIVAITPLRPAIRQARTRWQCRWRWQTSRRHLKVRFKCRMCTRKDASWNGKDLRTTVARLLSTTKWIRWTRRPDAGYPADVPPNRVSCWIYLEINWIKNKTNDAI